MIENPILSVFSKKYFWMLITVAGLALFLVFLPFLYNKFEYAGATGTTFTVCASGCDFTTISGALAEATLASGDTIQVAASYDTSSEPSPVTFADDGITLDCQNSGAVIGTGSGLKNIYLTTNSVIQNCSFNQVNIEASGGNESNVTITGNTFSTSTASIFIIDAPSSTISNNTGVNTINVNDATNVLVTGNTVDLYVGSPTLSYKGITANNLSNSTISSNIIRGYSTGTEALLISDQLDNVTISGNSLTYVIAPTSQVNSFYAMYILAATSTTITGNYLKFPSHNIESCVGIVLNDSNGQIQATVNNNTFYWENDCSGIMISAFTAADSPVSVTANYNLFYNASTTAVGAGIYGNKSNGSSFTVNNDYNGAYNLSDTITTGGSASITAGVNNITTNPCLRTENVSTTDDLYPAPFSPYLDVNGGNDIGAYNTSTRATEFTVDDDGTVDYSSIHTQDFSCLASSIRNNDTITISAGTYNGFSLPSSVTGVTINGAGATTVLNGTGSATPLALNSVSNSSFSNFVVQNASSTSETYTISNMIYDYGGNTYDAGGANMIFVLFSDCDNLITVTADDFDITAVVNTSNWNLALMNDAGTGMVGLARDDVFPDSGSVSTACGGLTIDAFVSDVFTYNAGDATFTYNAAAVSAASITVASGFTDPPTLTKNNLSYEYGIKLSNSSGNTFSTVTSTGNVYGIYFTGTSANNNFNDSIIQSSGTYDILSDGSGNNNVKNTTFDTSKTSITGSGDIHVYYKARGYVANNQSSAIEGAIVTFTAATSSITASSTSGSNGYTSYTDYLLAHIMDSTSTSTTNGSYNPYAVSVSATSTYSSSSTPATLSSRNQTVSLTMLSGAAAPSDLATSTVSATTVGLTWTDNASGATSEDSFLLDYIVSGGSFPGTTSTVSQNATSTTVSSLTPNTEYQFRIAAVNEIGTSAYSTSEEQYTNAAVPASVAGVANGQTSVIVSWNANNNPTSTVYELYDAGADTSIVTTTATSTTVTSLTASTGYTFKVRALYNSDDTTWSSFSDDSSEVTTASVGTSVEMTLGVGTSSTFQFTGGTSHSATLNSVVEGVSANLTIESTPITQDFSEGVADNIDTDGNGADDTTVTVSDITDSGSTITLASYTPPVVVTPTPSSGGGGSITTSAPVLGSTPISYNTTLGINNVVLNFNVQNAAQVAISDNPSFAGSSWQIYQTQKNVPLNTSETSKILYIKFRSSSGGETAVQKLTIQINPNIFIPDPIPAESSELAKADPFSLVKISDVNNQSFVQGQYLSFKYYFTNNTGKTLPVKVTRSLVNSAGKTVLVSNATSSLKPGSKFSRSISQNLSTRLTPGIYKQVVNFYDSRTGKKIAENSFEIIVEKKKVKQAVLSGTVENTGKTIVFDTTSLKVLKKPVTLPYSFRLKYSFKNQNNPSGYFDLVREIVDENGKVWQKNTGLWKSNKGQVRNINISQTIPNNLPAGNYLVRIRFSPRGKAKIAGENSYSFSVTDK